MADDKAEERAAGEERRSAEESGAEPRKDSEVKEPEAEPRKDSEVKEPEAEPRKDSEAEPRKEQQGAGEDRAAGEQGGPRPEIELPAVASKSGPQKGGAARTRKSRAERRAAREAVAGRDCPIVVDATNHVAGRLASNVAKLLLGGNRVSIVNCERIMISGTRSSIVGEYREFLEIASILHPKHGPFHPRRPDTIISRMIRGMLPREKPSGRAALRRLRAYIGAPRELGAYRRVRFERAMIKRAPSGYTTMESLGDAVGWTR